MTVKYIKKVEIYVIYIKWYQVLRIIPTFLAGSTGQLRYNQTNNCLRFFFN